MFVTMLVAVTTFVFVGLIASIPMCLLWNWLMPDIFDLPTINVIQAFGLQLLLTLLYPRSFNVGRKEDKKIDKNLDEKLEEVLVNMTTHFRA
ncbi:MAG: hypothetical protein CBD58_02110 [bacterium TMED198]|nr:MAG: hypothetical protein CBD58_02110 [bacterium TMED198]|tara:strand:- start:231 stop:506 length:276 start_codon:yes stop_codon:yes gene_type:complete